MKIFDCEQGSGDWLKLRLGKATASEFKKIVTPTGKLSKQATGYAYQLIAEELLGEPIKDLDNLYWVERGKMLEPDAAKLYELMTGEETTPVGFITNEAETIGCSPDRITRKGKGVEFKCPSPQTHIGYMIEGLDPIYKPQVQGSMYVTDLGEWDWFSYHPELPPVLITTPRDEEFIKILADSLNEFVDMKNKLLAQIKASNGLDKQDITKFLAA